MIQLHHGGVTLQNGVPAPAKTAAPALRDRTMAYQILRRHDKPAGDGLLHLTFDSLISHDITYVGVIQTAKASGMTEFPVPYVLTNCHNSLCAVGGTINEDDHVFGLSAAVKYGGDYVPANQAVIHQYAREMMSGCGRMILGSDSHARYGALGTMGVGEAVPRSSSSCCGTPTTSPRRRSFWCGSPASRPAASAPTTWPSPCAAQCIRTAS